MERTPEDDPMTEPAAEPSRPGAGGPTAWSWQLVLAAVLLVAFLAIGVLMIATADTPDAVWKNRIIIFGTFQSLVFGAVGWLFGREVNRVPAEIARADAREAKELAQDNADEAAEARVRAAAEETRGRALASAITATAGSTATGSTGVARDGNGLDRPSSSGLATVSALATASPAVASSQLVALAAMAEDLYGTR
jgi:hypothetical protein